MRLLWLVAGLFDNLTGKMQLRGVETIPVPPGESPA